MNFKQELKDLTERAKLSSKLITLINLAKHIESEITKVEQKIVKLDVEVAKNGLERNKIQSDQ
jgi:uncharacterized protein YfcZ (UPF0381/DUF406 family)|tara:strand:+ start:222 stop:410 length:189 start_codon:yes stop_codon:yes gene_type:complete